MPLGMAPRAYTAHLQADFLSSVEDWNAAGAFKTAVVAGE